MTREEAIEILKPFKACMFDQHGCPISDAAIALDMAIGALTERKTGKWIQISPAKIYECSRCGQNVMTNDIDSYLYCHGCGVKMEVENDL